MTWQPEACNSQEDDAPSAVVRMYAAPVDVSQPVCDVGGPPSRLNARPAPCSDAERQLVIHELQRSGYNITRTARALKVSRVTFYRMLRRNGLTLRQELVLGSVGTSGAEHAALG